jgi:hypothetical protein
MKKFLRKTYKGIPVIIIFIAVLLIGSGGMFAAIYLGGQGEIALQKGLVGHWKMDGNVKDSTPYGNDGTIVGATLTTDRKGQSDKSYNFDGSSYISMGNSADFNFSTEDFTISVWAKANSGTNGRGIINKGGWSSNGYYISEAYSPAYIYYFGVKDSSGYKVVQLPLQETWGWTHIVGIKTENHIEAWVNGNYVGQWNGTIGSLSNPSKNLEIGRSFNPSYFNGSIDEVRVYNRALSSDEIKALYESYNPGTQVADTQKGLVGHWKMDGDAKDNTPYGNDGTITGATLINDRKGQADGAYNFDGIDDYINVGEVKDIGETTVTLWFNSSDTKTGQSFFSFKDNNYYGGLHFNWDGAGRPLLYLNGSNYRYFASSAQSYLDGEWHFLVLYIKGSAQDDILEATLTIDNNLISAGSTSHSESPLSWTSLRIGDAYNNFNGSIDDFRVYNRALSSDEITALYESYDPEVQVSDTQKGLIAYLKMDGNAKDSTPYGNNGTVYGATLTTDRKGQSDKSYSFDGADDYMKIQHDSSQSITEISVVAWVKSTKNNASFQQGIVAKANLSGSELGWILRKGTDNKFYFSTGSGYPRSDVSTYSDIAYTDNDWHHIVGVRQSDGTNYIYIDGIRQAAHRTGSAITVAIQPITIGTAYGDLPLHIGSYQELFLGYIDDVRIYNRALSEDEVRMLYESY